LIALKSHLSTRFSAFKDLIEDGGTFRGCTWSFYRTVARPACREASPRPELEGEIHLLRNSSNVLSFDIFKAANPNIEYADIWNTSMKDDPSG
jgi:hypothetical protein